MIGLRAADKEKEVKGLGLGRSEKQHDTIRQHTNSTPCNNKQFRLRSDDVGAHEDECDSPNSRPSFSCTALARANLSIHPSISMFKYCTAIVPFTNTFLHLNRNRLLFALTLPGLSRPVLVQIPPSFQACASRGGVNWSSSDSSIPHSHSSGLTSARQDDQYGWMSVCGQEQNL